MLYFGLQKLFKPFSHKKSLILVGYQTLWGLSCDELCLVSVKDAVFA